MVCICHTINKENIQDTMRIGILTVPFNNNYGGFLQAFALKKLLTDMGHEAIFINRRRNRKSNYKTKIKSLLIKLHLREDRIKKISKYTDQFKRDYLYPITEEYYTAQELKKCLNYNFDYVIVGSDQVWRYRYAKDSIDDYYCSFLNGTNIPHFSYAASMGTDVMEYPQEKLELCSKLLKDFKAISVREQSTVDILKADFGVRHAQVVLDPTLLLDKRKYIDLFKDKYNACQKPYVFTYVLDENIELCNAIDDFASQHQMDIVNLRAQTGSIKEIKVIEPVEKWLSALYYSDYVITDSFHGTVFSLIFNKPFVVYGNSTRGLARLEDLLHRFGLSERLVSKSSDVCNILDTQVDWRKVENIIDKNKVASLSFLNNALRNDK